MPAAVREAVRGIVEAMGGMSKSEVLSMLLDGEGSKVNGGVLELRRLSARMLGSLCLAFHTIWRQFDPLISIH